MNLHTAIANRINRRRVRRAWLHGVELRLVRWSRYAANALHYFQRGMRLSDALHMADMVLPE